GHAIAPPFFGRAILTGHQGTTREKRSPCDTSTLAVLMNVSGVLPTTWDEKQCRKTFRHCFDTVRHCSTLHKERGHAHALREASRGAAGAGAGGLPAVAAGQLPAAQPDPPGGDPTAAGAASQWTRCGPGGGAGRDLAGLVLPDGPGLSPGPR